MSLCYVRAVANNHVTFGAAALPEPDRDWLAAVERLPIESVWQGGHLLPPTATGEAITRLALLTAWTERVRVGASVLLLPLYHPVIIAKQLADLDSRSARSSSTQASFGSRLSALAGPPGEGGGHVAVHDLDKYLILLMCGGVAPGWQ